ncbi:MAG: hypothetical protein IJR08_02555 [Bacilli bacterium]|nr:hypothetical protein [Bacilli bacterium]
MDLKNIKPLGRYYLNNHYYFYNGGSGFSFKVKGNSFIVNLKSKPIEGYFYIILDHNYFNKVKVITSDSPYRCSLKDDCEHYIDIIKANEANDNTFELVDLSVDGEILPFDYQYDKKVKVYGDSTIAGFGILSHEGDASIHTSDSVKDFCFKALYELNMEMEIVSASGYGLVFSAYTCPKNIGVIDYINNIAVSTRTPWNNNKPCDLLIISLGCNDNSYIQENINLKEELVKKFISKYQQLIDEEARLNKDLKILMVYGTLKEETAYYLYEKAYEYLKPIYKNLYIHKFDGDNTAISNHAYVTAHETMSEELKNVIKTILQ